MIKKLAIIGLSAILLGGCTLSDVLKTNNAAKDINLSSAPAPTPLPTPIPTQDPELQAIPPTSSANDEKSLETDIGNTTILNENFSDL